MAVQETHVQIPYLKEKATHKIYDNGYQFIYVPKRGDVFNVSTWVKTGSINENDINNGVSHFLEHLLFKGTERFKPGEFDRAMESMGAVINAATWKDFTFYYVTGPKGEEAKNFEKALDMHADMVLYSTLPVEEIGEQHDPEDANSKANKRERGVVIEEIGMRNDQPWTKIYNALNHMMYPVGHPYQRDVIGTRQIIGNIPREEIVNYYNTWYGAENLITIVVGDFDPEWLETKVLSYFNFEKQTQRIKNTNGKSYSTDLPLMERREDTLTGEFQTSFFILGFHGPKASNLKESIAVDVASRVLGEGRSSRLYQTLIEKPKAPVFNAISCGQSTFSLGNVFFVQGNFNSPDTQGCIEQARSVLRDYIDKNPITQDEFDRAVKKMKVDFAETSETASGIADTIGEAMTICGTIDGYIKYPEVLKSLTLEDVRQAARRWFDLDKSYTASLVPKETAHAA